MKVEFFEKVLRDTGQPMKEALRTLVTSFRDYPFVPPIIYSKL